MKLYIKESSEAKAKRLFQHPEYMDKIKTFAIFTAQNRDKISQSRAVNRELNKELKKDLAQKDIENSIINGRYSYYKVKGKYGNVENSFIVYNITLDDAKSLCAKNGQQSFIFAINDNGNLKFQFWANASRSGYSYKMVDEKEEFNILDDDAEDFYTQISRDFKFSIPFDKFEVAVSDMVESITNRAYSLGYTDEDIDRLIDESVNTDIYAKGRFFARASLVPVKHNKLNESYKDSNAYKKLAEYDYICEVDGNTVTIKWADDGAVYAKFTLTSPEEMFVDTDIDPYDDFGKAHGFDCWVIDDGNGLIDTDATTYDDAVVAAINYFWNHY